LMSPPCSFAVIAYLSITCCAQACGGPSQVMPIYGYARQDKKDKSRAAIR
jgi:phosphoribosylpyrophosphate synthetase